MLQLQKLKKEYITGDLKQTALDEVSLNFRDNEFVAILGPSGSGKTTLLNMIGGLDRYDSGDLIINGISTKKYKERDWDSYRNHTVGFVFQNYNLIPHQTILSNVELSLTISGISKAERKKRAMYALAEVGLANQHHKKPNQLSGGQMQRVAIARALVNNPSILLADEPTGALDSETSIQVMELLTQVAKDRLVIMVTHNPDLAKQYSNRIVQLKDGKITDDTNPYHVTAKSKEADQTKKNMGKASMSLMTALSLSFHNLRTKKGRTILTSFAGSIGIIGIALILSLSNGVSTYMNDIQKNTMTSYPIAVEKESIDTTVAFNERHKDSFNLTEANHEMDAVYTTGSDIETEVNLANSIKHNNLTAFKTYLDDPANEIHQYVGENGIVYSYNTNFSVYTYDENEELINTDGSSFSTDDTVAATESGEHNHGMFGSSEISAMMTKGNPNFGELIPGTDGALISNVITDNYEKIYGQWPEQYDEVMLVLNSNNEIATSALYNLGMLPACEYRDIKQQIADGKEIKIEEKRYDYEELCNQTFYMIPACDTYVKNANETYESIADSEEKIESMIPNAIPLKVVGVIKPISAEQNITIDCPIAYTKALTDYIIDYTNESEIVKAQMANPDVNVLTATRFTAETDTEKVNDATTYLKNMGVTKKANLAKQLAGEMTKEGSEEMDVMSMSEEELAGMIDQYLENPEEKEMLEAYSQLVPASTYEKNMESFGAVSLDSPSSVNIYADNFENKDAISKCIETYNSTAAVEDQISYVDYVGTLMSSVTTIINVVSYVLIAFVAVSLIVSSIMIGIITYISVLERTKEIGILRALGASRHNISQVFNAETFIIGLCSGAIGIGITLLLLIPGNMIIHSLIGTTAVNASLPVAGSILLVLLSVILTLIGGFIPSKHAARKDPVSALRSE